MIPLFKVFMNPSVGPQVVETLFSGVVTQGPKVEEYEAALREYFGLPHILTVNSGTSALQLALDLAGVNAGDTVISTPQTCFSARTLVRMADGSCMTIKELVDTKSTDNVLAYDEVLGKLVPTRITGWVRTDSVDWYTLTLQSSQPSHKGKLKSVKVTGDHKILTTVGYKRVDELVTTTEIITRFPALNAFQKEVVDGTLLGDAFIQAGGRRLQGRFAVAHTESQKEWLDLKLSVIENHTGNYRRRERYKHSKPCYTFQTFSTPLWKQYREEWYPQGKKVVPKSLTELTWLQVAIWYCDDGSLFNSKGALFCTDAFSHEDNLRLVQMLGDLGISARVGVRNRIYVDDALFLFANISPYVPECMRYKLNTRAVLQPYNRLLWLNEAQYVHFTDTAVVRKVETKRPTRVSAAYCIEVEKYHNFVVNNMIVSNCSATNTAILSRQANIVWADVDPNTGNVTAKTVERALEHAPTAPKAVMMVHWGGFPCDLQGVNSVAKKYGLKTIEDAAHAIGAKYQGAFVGAWSDYTAFSTQAIKHLTTVDGGLLMCKSEKDHNEGKLLRWFGLDRDGPKKSFRCELDLVRAGYKYHMNDVNATIGIENLKVLPWVLERHRENAQYYYKQLRPLIAAGITLMDQEAGYESSHWLFTLRLPEGKRDLFEEYMASQGVQCSQVHSPNHKHTFARNFGPTHLPGVELFSSTQTNIPVGWWVTFEEREHIVKSIHTFALEHLT